MPDCPYYHGADQFGDVMHIRCGYTTLCLPRAEAERRIADKCIDDYGSCELNKKTARDAATSEAGKEKYSLINFTTKGIKSQ